MSSKVVFFFFELEIILLYEIKKYFNIGEDEKYKSYGATTIDNPNFENMNTNNFK